MDPLTIALAIYGGYQGYKSSKKAGANTLGRILGTAIGAYGGYTGGHDYFYNGDLSIAKVYNSIYCSAECRKIITNKKLLANYYEKKANKNKKRICKTKTCTVVLSVYNKELICEKCKRERFVQRLVGWGWDETKVRDGM